MPPFTVMIWRVINNNNDPKFVELTADVLEIIFIYRKVDKFGQIQTKYS